MTTPTPQKMPDVIYAANLVGVKLWDDELEIYDPVFFTKYHADHVVTAIKELCDFIEQEKLDAMEGREQYKRERDALRTKYAALKAVADGMEDTLRMIDLVNHGNMWGAACQSPSGFKEAKEKSLTAYQAHKE